MFYYLLLFFILFAIHQRTYSEVAIQTPQRKYIGCFQDNEKFRDLKGKELTNFYSMTIENCLLFCSKYYYFFAGLQNGMDCFCGRSYGRYGVLEDYRCNQTCSGNNRQMCGSNLLNSIFEINPIFTKPVGCFLIDSQKALNTNYYVDIESNSIERCIQYCYRKGFSYAGVQKSSCLCGNSFKFSNSKCNLKCSGNSNQICGSSSLYSVYEIYAYENVLVPKFTEYVGCYMNDFLFPLSLIKSYVDFNQNTLEKCFSFCTKYKYKYAALFMGSECYCLNSFGNNYLLDDQECFLECTGDSNQICGAYSSSVYRLISFRNKYIGCYQDYQTNRDLQGLHYSDYRTNTIEKCLSYCSKNNFRYAALQFDSDCWCDNSFGKHGLLDPGVCNMKCNGDPMEICGGMEANNVYDLKPINYQYLGCFGDDINNRDLNGASYFGLNTNSIEICISFCSNKNFRYAAVQNGSDCFCDDSFGKRGILDEGVCNMKCSGNSLEICGASAANNVYDLKGFDYQYLGCYRDDVINRDLVGIAYFDPKNNSLQKCFNFCSKNNFRYAAVQYGQDCWCDNSFGKHGLLDEEVCNMECPGNKFEICGAYKANSVYDIKSNTYEYVGCFRDHQKGRDLNGASRTFYTTNSLQICFSFCSNNKFKYAGVQYGDNCWCDDSFGKYGRLDESYCSWSCVGNPKQICGAENANSVYRIFY